MRAEDFTAMGTKGGLSIDYGKGGGWTAFIGIVALHSYTPQQSRVSARPSSTVITATHSFSKSCTPAAETPVSPQRA